ncbi:MAG: hypothetical protein AB7K71_40300, partial [Polyangiaceae bacterium]
MRRFESWQSNWASTIRGADSQRIWARHDHHAVLEGFDLKGSLPRHWPRRRAYGPKVFALMLDPELAQRLWAASERLLGES